MRRITLWGLSTLTTLVLLFSYHTSTSSKSAPSAAPVVAQANTPAGASPGTPAPDPSTPSSTPTPTATQTTAAKTYDGTAVMTRYGNVQVQITVRGGRITKAQVLQVPWNDREDQMINSAAVPQLNAEVVAAQSASIDMVSGATFTSQGYVESLQSAIDQAHL